MMDIEEVSAGQMYRYYLRYVVNGDRRRPARKPLRAAEEEGGVPPRRRMGRGLSVIGLAAGGGVTAAQLRNLLGEGLTALAPPTACPLPPLRGEVWDTAAPRPSAARTSRP
jgi:hypothetical protein